MPATLQGAERKRAFEEALAAIFTLAAKRQPLAIVLEDWHWVDPTSDAVLKHLVGLIADYPVMVVLLCRPEYALDWAAPAQMTRIVLKPFSIADTGAMACTALTVASMPEELKALINERTAGNPLFIEEVCHALVEESIVSVSAGNATLTRRIETVQLPDTVQAVIRSRVDRLDKEAQGVLQLASVIGREFARTLLERVAAARDNLGQTLDTLRTEDLIRQVRVLPEPEYIFKHVLTQVVVYETLLLMRRQMLHDMVGQAIEELYADPLEEHYESLAYHYQRSDNKEKAIQYLELAGDKAKAQYVLQQTVKNYEQVIKLLRDVQPTPEAMRQHIDIAVKWADLIVPSAQVIEALQLAQRYAEELADDERLASVTSFLGQMLFYIGAFERAIPELQRVIGMAPVLQDQDRVGSCHRVLGHLYIWNDRRDDGLQSLEKAKPIVHRTGNHFEESGCIGLIAYELGRSGRFTESAATFEEAIRVARQSSQHSVEAWNLFWHGAVYCFKGDWHQALRRTDEAIALGQRIENLWAIAWSNVVRGYGLFMQGDHQEGLGTTLLGLEPLDRYDIVCISDAHAWYAEMLLLNGEVGQAAVWADKALSRLRLGHVTTTTRAHRVRALAKFNSQDANWTSIQSEIEETLVIAASRKLLPEAAITHFRYAEMLRARGDSEEARTHLGKASELFAQMDMTWWSEQAAKLTAALSR